MASHSSTLTWKIPWMEEPGALQSIGLLRVRKAEQLHFHFSLSCIGEGNGNPLQCSCLENPRDGEPGGLLSVVLHRVGMTEATQQPQQHIIQLSRSVVSDSLRPHGLQHARPPCPHQLLEFTQTHVHRVGDAIQPSHPLSSPSPTAPNPSQHQSLFQ